MSKFFKRTLTLILSCFALVAFCGFFNTVKVSANEAATPESVIAQINALPEIDEFRVSNASHLSAAQAAGEAYLSLSDEDKALVTNAAALLQYQKVVENSAGQYTWFHGSMDPQAYVNGAGETGGITLDESGNPTIRAYNSVFTVTHITFPVNTTAT